MDRNDFREYDKTSLYHWGIKGGMADAHKYIKRIGSPGNYKYIYQEDLEAAKKALRSKANSALNSATAVAKRAKSEAKSAKAQGERLYSRAKSEAKSARAQGERLYSRAKSEAMSARAQGERVYSRAKSEAKSAKTKGERLYSRAKSEADRTISTANDTKNKARNAINKAKNKTVNTIDSAKYKASNAVTDAENKIIKKTNRALDVANKARQFKSDLDYVTADNSKRVNKLYNDPDNPGLAKEAINLMDRAGRVQSVADGRSPRVKNYKINYRAKKYRRKK